MKNFAIFDGLKMVRDKMVKPLTEDLVLRFLKAVSLRPEKGLIANTNLGGDNAYHGAVLGAVFSAAKGVEGFPGRWIKGLLEPPPELL